MLGAGVLGELAGQGQVAGLGCPSVFSSSRWGQRLRPVCPVELVCGSKAIVNVTNIWKNTLLKCFKINLNLRPLPKGVEIAKGKGVRWL